MPVDQHAIVGELFATFDMVTVRELDIIKQLRTRHRRVRIAVLDDDTVTELYGRPPITPLPERALLAQHLRGIDEVVVHLAADIGTADDGRIRYVIAGEPIPTPDTCQVLTPGAVTSAVVINQATAARHEAVA